ncbi:MAG: hypothetical protein R3Y50_06000 [Rikenellaceae bacterium]
MNLTITTLLNDANIVKAVIDRTLAMGLDVIYWKRHFQFEPTQTRTFKTYLGTVTGVTAGSIIGANSNKPLRNRRSLGSGYGEVACLGDKYQMDNDRLAMLQLLIDKFNVAKTVDQQSALNDIIDYIVNDFRQVLLAPHKRMDLVTGSLRSTGKAEVKMADNPEGIEMLDMELPFEFITTAASEKNTFISYLKAQLEQLKTRFGAFQTIEMNRSTFNKAIVGCAEFGSTFKMILSNKDEMSLATGLITSQMATQVFTGIGLPAIVINEDMVEKEDGTFEKCFADDRISLFQSEDLGKMMYHTPYEIIDPIPGKTYTRSEGGMYVSNVRTDEGRFMEYGAEWIPNFKAPNKVVNFNLSTMLG